MFVFDSDVLIDFLRGDNERGARVAFELEFAVAGQHALTVVAVARVAAAAAGDLVLFVAQVLGHLGVEHLLHHRLLQLLEQPVVTQQLARVVHRCQQLLDQFLLLARHRWSPLLSRSLPVFRLHGLPDTLRAVHGFNAAELGREATYPPTHHRNTATAATTTSAPCSSWRSAAPPTRPRSPSPSRLPSISATAKGNVAANNPDSSPPPAP